MSLDNCDITIEGRDTVAVDGLNDNIHDNEDNDVGADERISEIKKKGMSLVMN